MKKNVIAILIVVALVIPMFCAPASALNGEELTFRGIKFGTAYNEVIEKIMEDIGETTYPKANSHPTSGSKTIEDIYEVTFHPNNLTVAGYDVQSLQLFFACTDNEKTTDNSILVCGRYEIELADVKYDVEKAKTVSDSVKEDLSNKLETLYGKYYLFEIYDKDDYWSSESSRIYYWADAEERAQYYNLRRGSFYIFQWEKYKDYFESLDDYIYMYTRFLFPYNSFTGEKEFHIEFEIAYQSVAAMRYAEEMRLKNEIIFEKPDTGDFGGL